MKPKTIILMVVAVVCGLAASYMTSKVIAERMHASLAHSAQLTVSMEVDMTDAVHLREQLRQLVAEDRRPTITDLVIRAARGGAVTAGHPGQDRVPRGQGGDRATEGARAWR